MTVKIPTVAQHMEAHNRAAASAQAAMQQYVTLLSLGEWSQADMMRDHIVENLDDQLGHLANAYRAVHLESHRH